MSHEIVFTSADVGLFPNSRGFCTVQATEGISRVLLERLEMLSGYQHPFSVGDERWDQSPVATSHLILTVGSQRYHVLSRVANAAGDYTARTNMLAHHVAYRPDETRATGIGPARVLALQGFSVTAYDGRPRSFPNGRPLPELAATPPRQPAVTWGRLTGDPGWAAVLAASVSDPTPRPMSVIFPVGAPTRDLLIEAMDLVDPAQRWNVTFSTYVRKLPAGVECQWRFLLDGTPEAEAVKRRQQSRLIDLTVPLGVAPTVALTPSARGEQLPPWALPKPQPVAPPPLTALTDPFGASPRGEDGELGFANDDDILVGVPIPDGFSGRLADGGVDLAASGPKPRPVIPPPPDADQYRLAPSAVGRGTLIEQHGAPKPPPMGTGFIKPTPRPTPGEGKRFGWGGTVLAIVACVVVLASVGGAIAAVMLLDRPDQLIAQNDHHDANLESPDLTATSPPETPTAASSKQMAVEAPVATESVIVPLPDDQAAGASATTANSSTGTLKAEADLTAPPPDVPDPAIEASNPGASETTTKKFGGQSDPVADENGRQPEEPMAEPFDIDQVKCDLDLLQTGASRGRLQFVGTPPQPVTLEIIHPDESTFRYKLFESEQPSDSQIVWELRNEKWNKSGPSLYEEVLATFTYSDCCITCDYALDSEKVSVQARPYHAILPFCAIRVAVGKHERLFPLSQPRSTIPLFAKVREGPTAGSVPTSSQTIIEGIPEHLYESLRIQIGPVSINSSGRRYVFDGLDSKLEKNSRSMAISPRNSPDLPKGLLDAWSHDQVVRSLVVENRLPLAYCGVKSAYSGGSLTLAVSSSFVSTVFKRPPFNTGPVNWVGLYSATPDGISSKPVSVGVPQATSWVNDRSLQLKKLVDNNSGDEKRVHELAKSEFATDSDRLLKWLRFHQEQLDKDLPAIIQRLSKGLPYRIYVKAGDLEIVLYQSEPPPTPPLP